MADEQNFKIYLSFKDEATGKFVKATEDQIASMKKLGLTVKKEGAGVGVDLDKMAKAHENAGRASRFHQSEIGKLAGSIGSLRNMILVWMFALSPIIDLIKGSIDAMMEQEDAIKRINHAMGLQGTQSKFMSDKLIELSKSFQETTRYGDEAILEVMEKLITMGNIMPSEIEKITQSVLDLSAATGRDLSTSADILVRASQGVTTGLRRMGIIIDEATPKARVLSEVMNFINKNMGGRAQADIDSYSGRIAQAKNAWNDMTESLGLFIAEFVQLKEVSKFYKEAIENLNASKKFDAIKEAQKQIAELNKELAHYEKYKDFKYLGFIPIPGQREEMEKQIAATKNFIKIQEEVIKSEQTRNIQKAVEAEKTSAIVREGQQKIKATEDFNTAYNSLASRRIEVERKSLNESYEIYQKYVDDKVALDSWYKEEKDKIDKEQKALEKSRMSVTYDAMTIFMQSYAKNMHSAMSDGFFKLVKGDFETLGDVVRTFGDAMLKTITDIIAQLIIMYVWKEAAGFLGYPGGIAHTGGLIYAKNTSYGMPRRKFHSGGEVPATLLEGEGVLNRRAMGNLGVSNLDKLNRGESAGGTTINNYYIQTIDERSFRERLQQNGDIYSNASSMNIKDNGSLRKTSQRYG